MQSVRDARLFYSPSESPENLAAAEEQLKLIGSIAKPQTQC